MTKHIIFSLLAALVLLASCSDGADNSASGQAVGKSGEMNVTANDGVWTYYSIEQNRVMGTSVFGDSTADSQWKQRTDWDIAICGDLIRTNSGTSGTGNGGLQVVPQGYNELENAPQSGYITDHFE
jgi:conserved domain protein